MVVTGVSGQEDQPAPGRGGAGAGGGRGGADRGASTRAFLGLGPAPDAAAAARGAPLYQKSCAFCHGPDARGAEGANLITSDVVLGDDHGEHLVPFLHAGRPTLGMPAFATVSDQDLTDIAEFLHQQVEAVANRGTYRIPNILVGNAESGKAYVSANCAACHAADAFDHIAAKFRSPDQLQQGWIWPARPADHSLDIKAIVTKADGTKVSGRVTQISDFRVTLVGGDGGSQTIERTAGVDVQLNDPLAPHQALIATLKNDDMHNVTAYLETLK